jgi:Thiamine monophosphate kinase
MAEFSIIDTYFNRQNINSVDLGVGDDSALLTPPPQQQLVICADTLLLDVTSPSTQTHMPWLEICCRQSL